MIADLHLAAYSLSGTTSDQVKKDIFNDIYSAFPQTKLLYITPEMAINSPKITSALESLYKRKLFSRLVVDEAHCLSQWGHDFRPEYQRLNELRMKFRDVPVMALTATANEKVKMDIIASLSLSGLFFKQSFNRPNLRYEVRQKGKACDKDIVSLIQSGYSGKSGIIYCFSKRHCEDLTDKLVCLLIHYLG